MTGGWRIRLKPGVLSRRRLVETERPKDAARPTSNENWRREDYACVTETPTSTFDPWALHPGRADTDQGSCREAQRSTPLLAPAPMPHSDEACPHKTEEDSGTKRTDAHLWPRRGGIVQHWSEAGQNASEIANRDALLRAASLDDPEEAPGLAFTANESDELVDQEWDELERAEEEARAGPIQAIPDEEELVHAIDPLDGGSQRHQDSSFDENEVGGVGEWDDTPDGLYTIGTIDGFDNSLHARSDWSDYVDDYDSSARQDIWKRAQDDADPTLVRARARAARIVSLLDLVRPAERETMLNLLVELFGHLQHGRTFFAIEALALEGTSAETLRSVIALKRCWIEHPEWWVGRYGWGYAITPLRTGASALSWRLASRICEARAEFPPEQMIDPDWFEEWLMLNPFEKGSLSFPDYLHRKVEALPAELLFVGLEAEAREAEPDEFADPIGWYRHLPTPPLIASVIAHGPVLLNERPAPPTV
jgi:hypothetical protein